jgi:hypothetical protein
MNLTHAAFLGFDKLAMTRLAVLAAPSGVGGYDKQLNEAAPYYDLAVQKATAPGVYFYMCTRNNNFSNRDQKGRIIVNKHPFHEEYVDSRGGSVQVNSNSVTVPAGLVSSLAKVRLTERAINDLRVTRVSGSFADQNLVESKLGSGFVQIEISELNKADMGDLELVKPVRVGLKLTRSAGAMESASVYRLGGDYVTMAKVADSDTSEGRVEFETRLASGTYVVMYERDYAPLIVSLVVLGVLVIVLVSAGVYLCRNRQVLRSVRYKAANLRRSMEMEL